jgi:hypothetical protein
MKYTIQVLLLAILIQGCAGLPQLSPTSGNLADCPAIHARSAWQFVHIIEAKPPGQAATTLIGVVQVTPATRHLHCVLMTLEGLVLFEADGVRPMRVLRALKPFANHGFAQGLMDDIKLIFLAPDVASQTTGLLSDGRVVCRCRLENGDVRDLIQTAGEGWELHSYRKGRTLTRTLVASGASPQTIASPMPAHLTLTAHGVLGYDLTLTLVDAQPLAPSMTDNESTP